MIGLAYLACLVLSLAAMVSIDIRFRLFLGAAPVRALAVLALGVVFFVVWDLFGIALGIFFRGETAFMTGVLLAPELPIEEPVFLLFLCDVTMVVFTGVLRIAEARRFRGAGVIAGADG